MRFGKITSLQNPHVKELVRLRERRHRDKTGLFLIEGYRELFRATEMKASLKSLYFCPTLFLGENERKILEAAWDGGAEIYELSKNAFEKVSYRDRPDGLLGVGYQTHRGLDELQVLLKDNPFLLVVEALEKPGNLGSIIRSSDGAGVDAVIVCDKGTDIHNPNVIRASVGTFFSVPLIEATSEETIQFLRKNKVVILAAIPSAKTTYSDVDYARPIAFAVGREQIGLSEIWMKETDIAICIPMKGIADSLNVSNATTILLYEALRQRR